MLLRLWGAFLAVVTVALVTVGSAVAAEAGHNARRGHKVAHSSKRCVVEHQARKARARRAGKSCSRTFVAIAAASSRRKRRPAPRPTSVKPVTHPAAPPLPVPTLTTPSSTPAPSVPTVSAPSSVPGHSSGSPTGGTGSTGSTGTGSTGGTGGTGGTGSTGSTGSPWTVQNHTETWAYDDCGNGGVGASASLVRSWVTDAEANCGPGGDAKTLSDCHSATQVFCNVIQYLDTDWIYQQGSPPWSVFNTVAPESWYLHAPGSSTSRIGINSYGGGYLINQSNPGVQTFFQTYVRANYNNADGLMMDDQAASLSQALYYSSCGCSSTAEESSDAALRAGHESMSAAMTHLGGQPFTQIDNSLSANPYLPQGLDMLNNTTGVEGLISEGVPESDGTLTPYYSTLLDDIAYVADETSSFVVPLSYAQAGASYQSQSRRVQEGTILLGYSPGHLVDWADLETGSSNLSVWPEEGIYPTEPIQTMSAPGGSGCLAGTGQVCSAGGHNNVQVTPGVYRREFGACDDQGTAFGGCATIVNTTSSPVTVSSSWLSQSYGHQITFNGGDVQSGGSLNLTGAPFSAGTTTVPAHDAILLAP